MSNWKALESVIPEKLRLMEALAVSSRTLTG